MQDQLVAAIHGFGDAAGFLVQAKDPAGSLKQRASQRYGARAESQQHLQSG